MAGRTAICESPVDEGAPGALLADPRKPASGAGGAICASTGMPSAGGMGAEKEDFEDDESEVVQDLLGGQGGQLEGDLAVPNFEDNNVELGTSVDLDASREHVQENLNVQNNLGRTKRRRNTKRTCLFRERDACV